MNTQEEFKISLEKPTKEFEEHLNIASNDRIVVSAPFGSGKTYFLKEFFKNNSKYDAIHIYPVNYSVASNEDIFELIKYDILFELLGKNIEYDKVEYSKLDYLPFFLDSNKTSVVETLTPLLSFIPKVGKSLANLSKSLLSFYKDFEQQHQDIQIDEKKSAIDYLESFTSKTGSIYEEDFYTQLISLLIEQLKKKDKKTVLIIDDLDRIDPEHIFRILNVFSAQIDRVGSDNKFDFDKIILVFDQENVRNIFKNRYGADVDYSGYIDKFYSYKIFDFYNPEGLKTKIRDLLKTINIKNKKIDFSNEEALTNGTVYIYHKLIEANALTIRRLLRILNSNLEYNYKKVQVKGLGKILSEQQFFTLFLARLLLFVYEDWEELMSSLSKIKIFSTNLTNEESWAILYMIESFIPVLDTKQHQLEEKEDDNYSYEYPDLKIKFEYQLKYDNRTSQYYATVEKNDIADDMYDILFIKMLYDSMEMIRDQNLLNE